MSASSSNDVLRGLLRSPPGDVEEFVRSGNAPEDFNWLLLAEKAAANALPLTPSDLATSLAWAEVAGLAYQRLAESGMRTKERSEEDLMWLRAELIMRHGPRKGDPFLDCDQIFDWFLNTYGSEFDAVRDATVPWPELPIARIRQLRQITHGLAILRRLAQCERSRTPEIQRWQALREKLP